MPVAVLIVKNIVIEHSYGQKCRFGIRNRMEVKEERKKGHPLSNLL
jgi:hypothetical protein